MSTLKIPTRQKRLLVLTSLAGLFLLFCSIFDLLPKSKLDVCIFTFSFGVPLALLAFDTIIDLSNRIIFKTWFMLSTILLAVSILAVKVNKFKVIYTIPLGQTPEVNSYIIDYSTSSLKSLFIFLTVYWLINGWLMKTRGVYIVNTFKQSKWYHDEAKRKITWLDVLINLILMLVIVAGCLFG